MTQPLDLILNTFSGADGGVAFIALRSLYEDMLKKASTGDEAAQQLVNVVHRFARLIEVAVRLQPTKG